MATIRTAISLYDGVSGPLRTMHRAMNVVMDSFEALNTASSGAINVSSIRQARAELSGVMSDFARTEEQIRNADDAQNELNSSIRGGSSAADTLLGRFKSLVATVGGLAAIKKVVGLSDELASTKARLNLIVDQQEPVPQLADASVHVGLDVDDSQLTDKLANTDARVGVTVDDGGSVDELERKIMASAQRSRAAYFDTASAVASMGANAKAAFSSNDELISFIEQVNKQFVIGGADVQGQAAAMLQLKQAMGMGVLRGEELNSVLENAPGIARIIEQYMGIAEGSIKSYAEKGAVTAEVVKDALLGAADETNAAFESMPMTWGQIWTSMQNKALSIFSPILQRINDIANTDKFSAVTDGLLHYTNMTVALEDYQIVDDASEGLDTTVQIELKQWKSYGTKRADITQAEDGTLTASVTSIRPAPSAPSPATYITKAGDTVWNIAKQLTGSGDSWLAIAKRSGLNTNTPEAGTLLDLRE